MAKHWDSFLSDCMTADVLTKALPQWKVVVHSLGLGLRQLSGGVQEYDGDKEKARP